MPNPSEIGLGGGGHANELAQSITQLQAEMAAVRAGLREVLESIRGAAKSHYTIDEVARMTGRAPCTVRAWVRDGKIRAERVTGTGPRGRLLIPREELRHLIRGGRGAKMPLGQHGDSAAPIPCEAEEGDTDQAP